VTEEAARWKLGRGNVGKGLKAAVDFLAAPYRYVVSDGFSKEVAEENTIIDSFSS
jgi:hypothetical protein